MTDVPSPVLNEDVHWEWGRLSSSCFLLLGTQFSHL